MPSQNESRQSITDRLVAALKSGSSIPWRRPWRLVGPRFPTNHITGRQYNGINVLTLWLAAEEKSFPVDLWGSYQQWASIGAQVKKGEKAERIVYYSPVKKRVKDDEGRERLESFPLLKTWSVFNIAQVEGDAVEKFHQQTSDQFDEPNREEFDRVVAATGADIRYGGDRALYYRLPQDYIQVPFEDQFETFPAFAEVVSHELLHWTEHRVGWQEEYAFGELRAEIGACFLTAATGLPDSGDLTHHAKYLESWLAALQNDSRYLFRAASAASKGVDFILGFSRPKSENETDDATAVVAA